MSTFYDIERAFQTKIKNIAATAGNPHIQFEGMEDYTPSLNEKYWRTNAGEQSVNYITAGSLREIRGIYRVEMIYPNNKGMKAIKIDQDLLANAFQLGMADVVYAETKIMIDGVSPGRVDREDNKLYSYIKIEYTCIST